MPFAEVGVHVPIPTLPVMFTFPVTSSVYAGAALPIPTLPASLILKSSAPPVEVFLSLAITNALVVEFESLSMSIKRFSSEATSPLASNRTSGQTCESPDAPPIQKFTALPICKSESGEFVPIPTLPSERTYNRETLPERKSATDLPVPVFAMFTPRP